MLGLGYVQGADWGADITATGDTMNLASRLQSAAPPGSIIISHDTFRYVRGIFDVAVQPPLTVRGKQEPIHTYLVRRASKYPTPTPISKDWTG